MLILLLTLSFFVFMNTIFYTIALLSLICVCIVYLVSHSLLSSLSALMIVIVYVGAVIILIGYVCAVCPNQLTNHSPYAKFYFLLFSFIFFLRNSLNFSFVSNNTQPVSFFYRSYGYFLFLVIALMLFITLLIVTSQYSNPKGPFRSL
jgi:hypothetical protein